MLRAGGAEAGKVEEVWGARLAIIIWLMKVNSQNLGLKGLCIITFPENKSMVPE